MRLLLALLLGAAAGAAAAVILSAYAELETAEPPRGAQSG